jgi:hypothetical protein
MSSLLIIFSALLWKVIFFLVRRLRAPVSSDENYNFQKKSEILTYKLNPNFHFSFPEGLE